MTLCQMKVSGSAPADAMFSGLFQVGRFVSIVERGSGFDGQSGAKDACYARADTGKS
jgi:hypothetical protein